MKADNVWVAVDTAKPNTDITQYEMSPELKIRLIAANLPLDNNGILMLWTNVKKQLDEVKADEMELRKITVKLFVPKPTEGTNHVDLGGGYDLKAVTAFEYQLDKDLDKVSEAQAEIANLSNEGAEIAEKLFKWTADLVLSEYRLLEQYAPDFNHIQQIKNIVDRVLTKKEKAPQLEVKEPKGKRK
jgi:hypothetical protein